MSATSTIAVRLSNVALFEHCTKSDLRIVARHAQRADLPAGTVVVGEGDAGDAFFLVLSGTAVVLRGGATVARLGPGDWFGELALLDPAPRSATVVTEEASELAVLGTRMFKVLLREIPGLSAGLLTGLARRLRAAEGPGRPDRGGST